MPGPDLIKRIILTMVVVAFPSWNSAAAQPTSADSHCHFKMNICPADSFYEPFFPFVCWDLYSSSPIRDTGSRETFSFTVPQDNQDSVSISITDLQEKEILFEQLPPLTPSKYVLSFPVVDSPGTYVVQIYLGKTFHAFGIIHLQEPPTPEKGRIAEGSYVTGGLLGTWERTYSQLVVPRLFSAKRSQAVDTVVEHITLRIDSCRFTIVWTAFNAGHGEFVHRYRGSVLLDANNLSLFDPMVGPGHWVCRARMTGDLLSLSDLHEMLGDLPLSTLRPIPNSVSMVLEGTYRRVDSE